MQSPCKDGGIMCVCVCLCLWEGGGLKHDAGSGGIFCAAAACRDKHRQVVFSGVLRITGA